ncbi:MAG: trans-sulfuration enzyme family protein [Actinomycetota bacterium]
MRDVSETLMGRPLDPGERAGRVFSPRTAPVVPPTHQSTVYLLDETTYDDIVKNEGLGEVWYTRFGNPTVAAAASEIAALEAAPAAVMTSSGMGAIATTMMALCRAGERIVSAREIYGDTRDLFVRDLPNLGIQVDFVDSVDLDAWRRALSNGPARLAYAESLSNPQLSLLDIPAVAEAAHRAGALLVVDNTFATPFMLRPLAHGADAVVHSVSKFLNGHSDVVAGCVASSPEIIREVQRRIITFGACLDPHAASLVWRGLKTFQVRLERETQSAMLIARFLEERDDVTRVFYPGLESHPGKAVADRLLTPGRTGAMVTFVVAGREARAGDFLKRLTIPAEATSLGGVETLVSMPITSSHFSLTEEELERAGIEPGMVRLSVGLEDADALIEDFRNALDSTLREGAGGA